jgi:hypothetical protein
MKVEAAGVASRRFVLMQKCEIVLVEDLENSSREISSNSSSASPKSTLSRPPPRCLDAGRSAASGLNPIPYLIVIGGAGCFSHQSLP